MNEAVAYAGLVGKYIRMERPATEAERASGDPETVGMEGVVESVVDSPAGVVVVADDGYMFTIKPGEQWSFSIWLDEVARSRWSA